MNEQAVHAAIGSPVVLEPSSTPDDDVGSPSDALVVVDSLLLVVLLSGVLSLVVLLPVASAGVPPLVSGEDVAFESRSDVAPVLEDAVSAPASVQGTAPSSLDGVHPAPTPKISAVAPMSFEMSCM